MNPNMPRVPGVSAGPGQEYARTQMTPEEQHNAELPTQIMQPLGNVAVKAESIPGILDTSGKPMNTVGNQVVMRRKRGERPDGTPIWENLAVSATPNQARLIQAHRRAQANRPAFLSEPEPTQVVMPPRPQRPIAPAPKPAATPKVAAPRVEREVKDQPTQSVPEAVSASQRSDVPPAEDIDFSQQSYLIQAGTQNKKARTRRAAPPASGKDTSTKAQPGAQTAAKHAEDIGEDFSSDIPRAAKPDDLRDMGPRRDRRQIHID